MTAGVPNSQATRGGAAELAAAILGDLRRLPDATTAAVRGVRRKYSKLLADAPAGLARDVVARVVAERTWATMVVASELLLAHPAAMARVDGRLIEHMAAGLDGWGPVDAFGVTAAGTAWRDGRITDERVMRWARSPDRWRRRLALAATVPLNSKARGGRGDADRTLAVCRTLAADRDDMVVKALSWALRELSKREPGIVAAFLRQEEARLAPRVRREVRATLETGRKTGRPASRAHGG